MSEAGKSKQEIAVRECTSIAEFDACVRLQREVFGLPDLEVSPRRHLVVSRAAGGWTLGAFAGDELVGFVLHVAAARGAEVVGYSHMTAVARAYQDRGVGARLKWAQRARALAEGRTFIKWTWEPTRARNAHFNLNRLGVVVRDYAVNFYGTDYSTQPGTTGAAHGLDSDRLFAGWELNSRRVAARACGASPPPDGAPTARVVIPPDWSDDFIRADPARARREQLRVREEFQQMLAAGLVCAGFERDPVRPCYLFYDADAVS